MQTQNRLLDDLARVASGAIGIAAGMRGEIEARLREQFEKILLQMDLVGREDFDVVKAMAAKARAEQEDLVKRVAILEQRLKAQADSGRKKASPRKRSAKSAE